MHGISMQTCTCIAYFSKVTIENGGLLPRPPQQRHKGSRLL